MKVSVAALWVLLAALGLSIDSRGAESVEVVLSDRLDEPRGFCLDVIGSQARAMPDRGLQAHSCYSYQGRLAVDQAFDAGRIASGEFRLPWFEVCMGAVLQEGARLTLEACDGHAAQRFDFTSQGRIVPRDAPGLCVTVADGPSTPGGGGRPVHVFRSLNLQRCDASSGHRQMWRTRAKAD